MSTTDTWPVLAGIIEPAPNRTRVALAPVCELLQEFEQATWIIADAEVDERSWARIRGTVIDLIRRGSATLAPPDGTPWTDIPWDEGDTAPMLARAFAMVHLRVAAHAVMVPESPLPLPFAARPEEAPCAV